MLLFLAFPAHAQSQRNPCFINSNGGCTSVGTANPLPVNASVSASITGFNQESVLTPFTATTGGVTSGSFTAGKVIVVTNTGTTNTAYCQLGASATTSSQPIAPNNGWFAFTSIAETQVTCATSTSTTDVNVSVGTGLPTGTGGGGGGGSGGGGAATIADGADVTQGAIADAAATAGSTGTLSAKLRLMTTQLATINTSINGSIPAGTAVIGKVSIDQTTPGTTNLVALAANQSVNTAQVNGVTVLTGTGATGTGAQRVTVSTDQATNAGAALKTGGVGVVNGGSDYETVAASQTAQVLGATGATGDYLSHCVLQPTTTGAGTMTILDNATVIFTFTTGTLSNLAPIPIPIGAISVSGAWKVTTGANETATCFGKFT